MRPDESPAEFMENLRQQSIRRRKEQYHRHNMLYLGLAVIVVGVLACFIMLGAPLLKFPQAMPHEPEAGLPSEDLPPASIDSYLQSAGMDASASLRLVTTEVKQSGSRSWVEGTIRNDGRQGFKGFAIYFQLYDAGGKPLGSSYVLMGSIKSGETKSFATAPIPGMAAKAGLEYVIGT